MEQINLLPLEIEKKINNIILEEYEKLFNIYRKKSIERNIIETYNDLDPYDCSFSNMYNEIIGVYATQFKIRYNQ